MRFLYGFWKDVRFGARSLLRRPLWTATALASIVVGVGLNTAIAALLAAVFERPLAVESPGRLVRIYQTLRNAPPIALDLRKTAS